ncbi:MAG: putative transcriptional regulator [Natronomonas sp.]|jgi:predicted transcriptional regulator
MAPNKTETFVRTITDDECCRLLSAIETEAKAVKELSEECEIPLSTTYRKVNRLQEAGLVREKIRLSSSGNHTSVYEQEFDGARITLSNDGEFEVELVSEQRQSNRRKITAD